jgi:hypothetical protein
MASIGLEHAPVVDAKQSVLVFLARDAIADNQEVDVGSHKAAERVFRVQTIGSLLTLKLVFTRTGQPVRALKAESSA